MAIFKKEFPIYSRRLQLIQISDALILDILYNFVNLRLIFYDT